MVRYLWILGVSAILIGMAEGPFVQFARQTEVNGLRKDLEVIEAVLVRIDTSQRSARLLDSWASVPKVCRSGVFTPDHTETAVLNGFKPVFDAQLACRIPPELEAAGLDPIIARDWMIDTHLESAIRQWEWVSRTYTITDRRGSTRSYSRLKDATLRHVARETIDNNLRRANALAAQSVFSYMNVCGNTDCYVRAKPDETPPQIFTQESLNIDIWE